MNPLFMNLFLYVLIISTKKLCFDLPAVNIICDAHTASLSISPNIAFEIKSFKKCIYHNLPYELFAYVVAATDNLTESYIKEIRSIQALFLKHSPKALNTCFQLLRTSLEKYCLLLAFNIRKIIDFKALHKNWRDAINKARDEFLKLGIDESGYVEILTIKDKEKLYGVITSACNNLVSGSREHTEYCIAYKKLIRAYTKEMIWFYTELIRITEQ